MSRYIRSIHYKATNLEKNLQYYQQHFGTQIERLESPDQANVKFEGAQTVVTVTEEKSQTLELGTGYGHLALKAPNIYEVCEKIKAEGGKVTREPGPVKGGTTVIAFVEDWDAKKFELIQRGDDWKCTLLHLMIRVKNLEDSIDFYTNALGMKLLRKSENRQYEYTLAFVGYQEEENSTVLELTYNWDGRDYDLGNTYQKIIIAAQNSKELLESMKAKGVPFVNENTVKDPTGYLITIEEM